MKKITLVTILLSLFISSGLIAQTIYVDDDNPDPGWYDGTHVHTITEGITAASAGDTVYVYIWDIRWVCNSR